MNKVTRKNLKFQHSKREQYNALCFLSKIEGFQTAFVSYLTERYLSENGIEDAESLSEGDAMILYFKLKAASTSGQKISFANETTVNSQSQNPEEKTKEKGKTERSVPDVEEGVKQSIMKKSERSVIETPEDESEETINKDLFDSLDMFFG